MTEEDDLMDPDYLDHLYMCYLEAGGEGEPMNFDEWLEEHKRENQ